MKKISLIILLFSIAVNAQSNFSFGLVGSQFDNLGSGQKLTKINNPLGYGIIFGYQLDKNLSFALTSEFLNGNLKNNLGKESDYRVHLSAFLTPLNYKNLRAYISTGFVFTRSDYNYNFTKDENKSFFNGRFGAGLDYKLIQNLSLNVDFGFYNDGLMLSGWSSSLGIRFTPNIF